MVQVGKTKFAKGDTDDGLVVLRDGMVLLREYMDLPTQQRIIDTVREMGVGKGGFYTPTYEAKKQGDQKSSLHLRMLCLGKHWNAQERRYETERTDVDGLPVHELPAVLKDLYAPVIKETIDKLKRNKSRSKYACGSLIKVPVVPPDIALCNFYSHGGRLGLHQDQEESEESKRLGCPVVSLSIGDSCDFFYCESRPSDDMFGAKEQRVRLNSGDLLIFGGASRMIYHAVGQIHAHSAPFGLRMREGRLNVTLRKY